MKYKMKIKKKKNSFLFRFHKALKKHRDLIPIKSFSQSSRYHFISPFLMYLKYIKFCVYVCNHYVYMKNIYNVLQDNNGERWSRSQNHPVYVYVVKQSRYWVYVYTIYICTTLLVESFVTAALYIFIETFSKWIDGIRWLLL